MKKEISKKSKMWVWLAVGLAVLVVVAAVLAILLGRQETPAVQGRAKLYWNVDRLSFVEEDSGMSLREPGADGLYHIRFAVDGEQVEIPVINDKKLVNYLDSNDLVTLVMDADGIVVNAEPPESVATELADSYFVSGIDGTDIVLNSSVAMNGMELNIALTQDTGVYNVDPSAEVVGQLDTPELLDMVRVYADATGAVTHVFIVQRVPQAEVYWRVERMFDVTKSQTTRVPDEDGVYTILFAKDGEQVEMKCRDEELVTLIDSNSELYGDYGLVLDEEGYITAEIDAFQALRGKLLCKDAYVTKMEGDTVSATIASGGEKGKPISFTLNDSCNIFRVCGGCYEHHIGERVDGLKLDDRVRVYTNMQDEPVLVYVIESTVEGPMYFNLKQKYDYTKKDTTRVPDANGYYVFDMLQEGEQVTVKTKDKELARQIDSQAHGCFGLKLNGSIIERVYRATCISGGAMTGYNRYVTSFASPVISMSSYEDFSKTFSGVLSADCKVYDVTGFLGVKLGATAQVRKGDRVTGWLNAQGEVEYIYITERYMEGTKLYYNIGRLYDSKLGETTRKPDAEGYYVFTMVCYGEPVTVKTKNRELASYIDKQDAPLVAMVVKNGIVQQAYPAVSAIQYSMKTANYHYVNEIKGNRFTTYYVINGVRSEGSREQVMAENCVVYNVSACFKGYRGEKTTLQPDDQIQAISVNPEGKIVQIYVMGRKVDTPLYWKTERKYDAKAGETLREPNAEGYYIFDVAVNGMVKQYKTKDKTLASTVESFTQAFTMVTKGDIIQYAYGPLISKSVKSTTAGNFDVMAINGNKATVKRNYPQASNYGDSYEITFAKDCKFYNVSAYAKQFGAATKLKLGDRITCFTNSAGEVVYCYVVYANTRQEGHISVCEHCNKEVFWEPFIGDKFIDGVHYYLTHDIRISWGTPVGSAEEKPDAVLDLNGYTYSNPGRAMNIFGTLSIFDSRGGGSITTGGNTGWAGAILLTPGSKLNLFGGTLATTQDAPESSRGGVIYIDGKGTEFNMYGGSVAAGKSALGNSICTTGGKINIYGGTVGGAQADNTDSIYVNQGVLNLHGGKIDGGITVVGKSTASVSGAAVVTGSGLKLPSGIKMTLGEMKDGASIVISATGVFTAPTEKAETYKKYFHPAEATDTIEAVDNVLKYDKPSELKLDANNVGYCPVCERDVTWTDILSDGNKRVGYEKSGHYYLSDDAKCATEVNNFASVKSGQTLCIHLNGKTVSFGSRIAVDYIDTTLNIMGTGTVKIGAYTGTDTATNSYAGLQVNKGTVNLYGGTYIMEDATRPLAAVRNAAAALNIYEGVTIDSSAAGTAILAVKGNVLLAGSNVTGGVDSQGGSITLNGTTTVDSISVAETAKLIVAAEWSGEAKASFATLNGNLIPAANGESLGEYTGKLYLDAEGNPAIIANNGGLEVYKENPYTKPLEFAEDGMTAYCPVCQEDVQWIEISEANSRIGGLNSVSGKHYYLSTNIVDGNQFCELINSSVCLHLNGYDLTTGGRINATTGSTLNIVGAGTVTCDGAYTADNAQDHVVATLQAVGTDAVINLHSGTYKCTAEELPVALVQEGGALNVYQGAVIEGSETNTGILAVNGSVLLAGGKVTGGVDAREGTVTLSGTTVTDSISVAQAAKLIVAADWTGEAKASFATPGAGTIPVENGESLGDYTGKLYLDTEGNPVITGKDGALVYESNPYIQSLDFKTGGTAYCPACKEEVTWTEISTNGRIGDSKTGHYYLSSEVNFDGALEFANAKKDSTLCIHLNGNNLSYNGRIGVVYDNSTVNIMGSGEVTIKPYTGTGTTSGLQVAKVGALNLYGGTYIMEDANRPLATVSKAGAELNIYEGATLNGNGCSYISVTAGTLNLYGGTIKNGNNSGDGGNVLVTGANAEFNIESGTVKDGNAAGNGGNIKVAGGASLFVADATISNGNSSLAATKNIYISNGTVHISGGSIDGGVFAEGFTSFTLSGAPVITSKDGNGLRLTTGKLLTLGELTEGASICVTKPTDGTAISVANGKAADYVKYFSSKEGYDVHYNTETRQLYVGVDYTANLVDADAATDGLQAVCPVCGGEAVTWTELTARVGDSKTGHYYLSSEVNFDGALEFANAKKDSTLCIHLNGNNLSYNGRIGVVYDNSTVNIMGSGEVTIKPYTGTGTTSGLQVAKVGALNLYGGTYIMEDANRPLATVSKAGAELNIYEGATLDGNGCSYISVTAGTLNLYGGTIKNGNNGDKGGNIFVYGADAKMNMVYGTVVGGAAAGNGGNIYVGGGANFTMAGGSVSGGTGAYASNRNMHIVGSATEVAISGGSIDGGVFVESFDTFTVSGAPTITGADGNGLRIEGGRLLTLGELTEGASICVTKPTNGTAFSVANATDYAQYFTTKNGYEVFYNSQTQQLHIAQETAEEG